MINKFLFNPKSHEVNFKTKFNLISLYAYEKNNFRRKPYKYDILLFFHMKLYISFSRVTYISFKQILYLFLTYLLLGTITNYLLCLQLLSREIFSKYVQKISLTQILDFFPDIKLYQSLRKHQI